MFGKKKEIWSEKKEHKIPLISLVDVLKQLEEMHDESIDEIVMNKKYLMSKKIAGVEIEVGFLRMEWMDKQKILKFLQDFFPKGDFSYHFQNMDAVIEWTKYFQLEIPDPQFCEGYILNNELVSFDNDIITLKYKENLESTFILYQISFFKIQENYGILIKKTF